MKEQKTYISTAMWRSAILAIMLIIISIPSGAQAGVFSNFASIFSNTVEYTTQSSYNSQTIPLPEAAKNIDPNPSKGGGNITIVNDSALLPSSGPSGTSADVIGDISNKNHGQISVYIVRKGDTLGEIAGMFGVSINTIRWGNDISRRESIQPGQELVILPVSGIKYKVKKGGTLRDIIKIYGGNLDEAVAYNKYGADEQLSAGTEVIIPDGELSVTKSVANVAKSRYTRRSTIVKGANAPYYKGYYIHPLPSGIKTQGLHGYNGIDIGAPRGTPLIAAASGKVIRSKSTGWNGGYGKYVVIKHPNNTQTLYAHMNKVIVFSGQTVVQGQVIGFVGSTGNSTGNHVHFEIRGAKNPF